MERMERMTRGMFTELSKILADVSEKTGADVYLLPRGGEETCFPITYRGERADVYISGTGEEAEREAKLIAYFVENADVHTFIPAKEEGLRTILLGDGGGWYPFRFMTKFNLPDGMCFAVDILPDKRADEAYAQLERTLDRPDMVARMGDNRIAVVHFADGGQNANEFAQFLRESLYEELGVKASIGVGCEVRSFADILRSYLQAVTAVRVSAIFQSAGEVHSFREYLLVKILEDMPKSRMREYIDQFRSEEAKEVFEDPEMMDTAESFLDNNLRFADASRALFMHRNTLMYRLDKVEHCTGLDIRKFSDAVTFRIISLL